MSFVKHCEDELKEVGSQTATLLLVSASMGAFASVALQTYIVSNGISNIFVIGILACFFVMMIGLGFLGLFFFTATIIYIGKKIIRHLP